jgi:large-conductance mechanosensitive channel
VTRGVMVDVAIGVGIGLAMAALVLLSSFNSTFIYRGF